MISPELTLIRDSVYGKAINGHFHLDLMPNDVLYADWPTIENADYLIPPGRYRLGLHRRPKTGAVVPYLYDVPATPEYPSADGKTSGYRSYILIHTGTRPEHSLGCILARAEAVNNLVKIIKVTQESHGKIFLTVEDTPSAIATPCAHRMQSATNRACGAQGGQA